MPVIRGIALYLLCAGDIDGAKFALILSMCMHFAFWLAGLLSKD